MKSISQKPLPIIVGLLVFSSCFSFEPTAWEDRYYEKERHKIFRKEHFDPEVVKRTEQYVELINFLLEDLDKIVNSCGEDRRDSILYMFNAGRMKLPEYKEAKFLELTKGFPEGAFEGYGLSHLNQYVPSHPQWQVWISLDNHEPEPTASDPLTLHIRKQHYLLFNDAPKPPVDTCLSKTCDLVKDTLLSQNLRYVIAVYRYLGW